MAIYSIRTTRTQEAGLKYTYDHYADHTVYTTQAAFFQYRIDTQVTNPMYLEQQRANSVALDQSIATIPEAEMPAAEAEIKQVIVNHGGTLVPPGPVSLPPAEMLAPPLEQPPAMLDEEGSV